MLIREIVTSSNELIEHAIAMRGDYRVAEEEIQQLSETCYRLYWDDVCDIDINNNTYRIIMSKSSETYTIGFWDRNDEGKYVFKNVAFIELNDAINLARTLKIYPDLKSVSLVNVKETFRGHGIAKALYQWLVTRQGFTILGDTQQYFGARRLWANLSKISTLRVDVIDAQRGIILEKGRIIDHGKMDHEFDPSIWSYGSDMTHIRLVLTDIQ